MLALEPSASGRWCLVSVRAAQVPGLLVSIAVHKSSRLVTRDRVTSVLRAPFTRYQKDAFWEDLKLLPPTVKLV